MKPTQVTLTPVWRQVRDPLNTYWAKPRMSWDVLNTFNIWQRTHPDGTHRKEIQFGQSSKSIYQQRVIAIRFLKGYHAEVVRTKKFERWYLPNKLPAIHVEPPKNVDVTSFVEGRERAGGRTRDDKFALRKQEMAQVPIGSMLYGQVERRLDTVVFRACFAPSIYAARMAVTTGKVKLNGQTVRNPNVLLNPGDLFTVDPQAISFIQDPELQSKKAKGEEEDAKEVDSEESAVEAESSAEAATSEATESANATITTPPTPSTPTSPASKPTTFFRLPHYAQAHIFVPAYILPNYKTCSAVYVRHPTARANYSEVPSPFDAGGELTSLAWEWYTHKAPRMRSKVFRWENPQRSKIRWQIPRPEFMKGPETYAEKKTLRSKDAAEKKFRRSKMFPPGVRPA